MTVQRMWPGEWVATGEATWRARCSSGGEGVSRSSPRRQFVGRRPLGRTHGRGVARLLGNGVMFLPHMAASACPVVDPRSFGAFVGLSTRTPREADHRATVPQVPLVKNHCGWLGHSLTEIQCGLL